MRQLSLYQLQYRFMEGGLSRRPPVYIVSICGPPGTSDSFTMPIAIPSAAPCPCVLASAPLPSFSVKGLVPLVQVQSPHFCFVCSLLSFVAHFSQVDLLCVSLSRLFQRLPLIFLSGGDPRKTIPLSPFLQSRYLAVLSACLSPFAAKSAAILLFSWEGKGS